MFQKLIGLDLDWLDQIFLTEELTRQVDLIEIRK